MNFADALASRLEISNRKDRWMHDPVAWVQERLGEEMWSRQIEIMRAVGENPQVAVQSGHGIGKSWLASRLVAWWLDTRPQDNNTFVVTTAPTANQVKVVLWRYIQDVWGKHNLVGRVTGGNVPEWKIGNQIMAFGRSPSDYNESAFQGVHAKHLLVILDEACGITEQLWNACHALATGSENHILAIGNPDRTSSHFHKVCTTEPGWHRIRISSLDSPNLSGEPVSDQLRDTLVKPDWIDRAKARWGENSSIYKAKVLGEWADDEDGLIPMSWVRAANDRWEAWKDAGGHQPPGRTVFRVDVAYTGDDKTVICTRKGDVVMSVEPFAHRDTVQVANLVEARMLDWVDPVAVIDTVGVGVGVLDRLRHRGFSVQGFNAGKSGGKKADGTDELKFLNWRAAAWWNMRELLDPAMDARLALPPNDDLTADLTAPWFEPVAGGKIKVAAKDEIRKRLGRSTDYGDAVIQAMWSERLERHYDGAPVELEPIVYADAEAWQNW